MLEIIQRLKEKVGLAFYLHPQKYDISCEVVLKNIASGTKDFHLILPLPRDGSGQRVLVQPVVFPHPRNVKKDQTFNNPYAVFVGTAEAGENLIFRYTAQITTEPRDVLPNQTFTSTDYDRLVPGELTMWTRPTFHIDSRDPRVLALAEEAKKGASDVSSILNNLNEFVIQRLKYGAPIDGLYTVDQVLKNDQVDCGGFDVLFVSLCRVLGIPARLVSGFWIGHKKNTMHAWAEVLLPDGQWLPLDPSVEYLSRKGRTLKSGRLGFVGSDRLVLSYDADVPIEIDGQKVTADLLQHPFLVSAEERTHFSISTNITAQRL